MNQQPDLTDVRDRGAIQAVESSSLPCRVFISYSRANAADAEEVRRCVQAIGADVWIDRQTPGGTLWWEELLRQIRQCHLFIQVISEASLRSEACRAEWHYAHRLNRPFLGLRIDGVNLVKAPPEMRRTHILDIRSDNEDHFESLRAAIAATDLTTPLPADLPPNPDAPQSYGERYSKVYDSMMSLDDQVECLGRLLVDLAGEHRSEALEILALLRKRPDVYFTVRELIDREYEMIERDVAERHSAQRRQRAKRGWLVVGVLALLASLIPFATSGKAERLFPVAVVASMALVLVVVFAIRRRHTAKRSSLKPVPPPSVDRSGHVATDPDRISPAVPIAPARATTPDGARPKPGNVVWTNTKVTHVPSPAAELPQPAQGESWWKRTAVDANVWTSAATPDAAKTPDSTPPPSSEGTHWWRAHSPSAQQIGST